MDNKDRDESIALVTEIRNYLREMNLNVIELNWKDKEASECMFQISGSDRSSKTHQVIIKRLK